MDHFGMKNAQMNRRHNDPQATPSENLYEIVCNKIGGGIHRVGPFPLAQIGEMYKNLHLANKIHAEAHGVPLYSNIMLQQMDVL